MKFAFHAAVAFCLLLLASCDIPAFGQVVTPVITGQTKVASTGTAVQLPGNDLLNGVIVKALSSNNATCATVGPSTVTNTVDGTGNGYVLCPGEAASFAVPNTNRLWVNGTTADKFTFEGN